MKPTYSAVLFKHNFFCFDKQLRVNQDGLEAEMTLQLQEEEEELQQQQLQQQPLLTTSTSKTQFRANVVNEIISAEKEYVKHLHDVIEVCFHITDQ